MLSDIIEEFIKDLFGGKDKIEIQRNELADHFNCVPSQINYVLETRFKPSQGYYVESKRGGGGHITITRIDILDDEYFGALIENIGDSISQKDTDLVISELLSYNLVTEEEAKLMKVATSDKVLKLDRDVRDKVRARILKNMLLNLSWNKKMLGGIYYVMW